VQDDGTVTITQRIGTIFLTIGSIVVLCVALIWLAAPSVKPASFAKTTLPVISNSTGTAPALAPFVPPSLITNEEYSPLVEGISSVPAIDETAGSLLHSLSNWSVISYAEAKALRTHDRALANPSMHLSIPALDINAPIIPVTLDNKQNSRGRSYRQWTVPREYAVGWHDSSASPGQAGNTVLNGHNNVHGAVFGNLVDLALGEQIILHENEREYIYHVVHREFLPEKGEPLRTRLRNARWISPSNDTRLTLVTCWPNSSNSHRLVVVAQPLITEPGF
jgi:LPXTG-site transpeptidase (sortase) family protein